MHTVGAHMLVAHASKKGGSSAYMTNIHAGKTLNTKTASSEKIITNYDHIPKILLIFLEMGWPVGLILWVFESPITKHRRRKCNAIK
jgi:hypothetical protein